jgi:hypothetical protein
MAEKKRKNAILAKLDADGDGEFTIEDVVYSSFRASGVYIRREEYLREQFAGSHRDAVVEDAIARTPALAGISVEEIDWLADRAIRAEHLKVTGVSAALGMPGGAAIAATIPADLVQYFGFLLRIVQKLLYLYGFPDVDADPEEGIQPDGEIMDTLILCLGVMYDVDGSAIALKALANGMAKGMGKRMMGMVLRKGSIRPVVKQISKWFGLRLGRSALAKAAGTVVPVLGGVVAGSVTFFSFRSGCARLKRDLKQTRLADPDLKLPEEE